MCGITGFYAVPEAATKVREALTIMAQRGTEAAGVYDGIVTHAGSPAALPYSGSDFALGHVLHAMVGCVAQPVQGKGVLVANCEIYNWKELAKHEHITVENDTQVLLHLLDKHYPHLDKVFAQIDGVYAFAYERDGVVTIARDILGVKPLYYSTQHGFAFASERKALLSYFTPRELLPRTVLQYDAKTKQATEYQRDFFTITLENTEPYEEQKQRVEELLRAAVEKRVPDAPFGVLLSGGIDSSTISLLLAKHNPIFYTVGLPGTPDLDASESFAKQHGLQLRVLSPTLEELEAALPAIIRTVEDGNPVKASVAATLWFACAAAQKDGCKAIFSGLGAEELFAGYERHRKSTDPNRECLAGLRKLHERDLYRDDVITMYHGIELRLPFLDKALVEYSLRIPAQYKLRDGKDKAILRDAAVAIGLSTTFAYRPKKAAQYGSGIMKLMLKLARKKRVLLAEYLSTLLGSKNKKLASMLSTGKDSLLALHVMHRMQYTISCCVTIDSENPDSYMYHTPNVHLAQLQAQALGLPLITAKTKGEQEEELDALAEALIKAKDEHGVEGVITGALASQYQRERVEQVCDRLGLTVFSPLWQMDQEKELHLLLAEGFSVVFTKVAADGLDASWLGKHLDKERLKKLVQLQQSHGVHPAGEGGEYESLVLDAPLFARKIVLGKTEVIKDGSAATLLIKEAHLAHK